MGRRSHLHAAEPTFPVCPGFTSRFYRGLALRVSALGRTSPVTVSPPAGLSPVQHGQARRKRSEYAIASRKAKASFNYRFSERSSALREKALAQDGSQERMLKMLENRLDKLFRLVSSQRFPVLATGQPWYVTVNGRVVTSQLHLGASGDLSWLRSQGQPPNRLEGTGIPRFWPTFPPIWSSTNQLSRQGECPDRAGYGCGWKSTNCDGGGSSTAGKGRILRTFPSVFVAFDHALAGFFDGKGAVANRAGGWADPVQRLVSFTRAQDAWHWWSDLIAGFSGCGVSINRQKAECLHTGNRWGKHHALIAIVPGQRGGHRTPPYWSITWLSRLDGDRSTSTIS